MTLRHAHRASFKARIAREAADRFAVLLNDFVRWFDPDQPRTPAGQPGGGQWVGGGQGQVSIQSIASRRISASLAAECDQRLQDDIRFCRAQKQVIFSICQSQAMERYASCLAMKPIPPLLF